MFATSGGAGHVLAEVAGMALQADEVREIEQIVAETVRQTLIQLGISTVDPLEMQKDMQHLREWRKSMESIKSKAMLTTLTVFLSGILAAIWLGFRALVKGE
jgi:hypothetical protein